MAEKMELHDSRQYGFRKNRSTVQAVSDLLKWINTEKEQGKHVLIVTLDLRNAFNRATQTGRKIISKQVAMEIEKVCPQGSNLGPTLWLLGMNIWFRKVSKSEVGDFGMRIQVFADDQVIALSNKYIRNRLDLAWNNCWEYWQKWADGAGAEYNKAKTEACCFWSKKNRRQPTVKLGEDIIQVKDTIKCLGVTIDSKQQYIRQIQLLRKKTDMVMCRLWGTLRRRSNPMAPEHMRQIYDVVIKPAVLYGAEIWVYRASMGRARTALPAAQRTALLAITGAYRTTSNDALQVIAETPPLYLEAEIQGWAAEKYGYPNGPKGLEPKKLPWPWEEPCENRTNSVGNTKIWTDASAKEGKAGIGIVIRTGTNAQEEISLMIKDESSSREAEFVAVQKAIEMVRDRSLLGPITIRTDSRMSIWWAEHANTRNKDIMQIKATLLDLQKSGSEISLKWCRRMTTKEMITADRLAREATANEGIGLENHGWISTRTINRIRRRRRRRWQMHWEQSIRGRTLCIYCQQVGRGNIGLSRKAVQLMTGHGNMQAYLHIFKLKKTDGLCECRTGPEDTTHILETCEIMKRVEARNRHRTADGNHQLRNAEGIVNKETVTEINACSDTVIDYEENYTQDAGVQESCQLEISEEI
ncbi:uncharacterized protein LOC143205560 [Rhynchophorus ferrugineus]|uniref:uncharacterized protein LOC143205560 n=1 Tax=Rhynchophorus ferrugineus TaxID=354439 RepID=UPI003FCD383B